MIITNIETFILHVPVTRQGIADSTHRITHWGAPGVILHTDAGLKGYGYTGTHAHLALDRLIRDCIAEVYAELLLSEEAHDIDRLWNRLYRYPPAQWVGRCGITHLALSAVDVALWDLNAKAADLPLWRYLQQKHPTCSRTELPNGQARPLTAYNTDGGWLNWTQEQLVADCRRMVQEEGYPGVKIKVGSSDPEDDLRRLEAVRNAIGPDADLMADVNGKWSLETALRFGPRLSDYDLVWLEEPLWYDALQDHALLARSISTPIALGEQLYMVEEFRNFIEADAVRYVQPDAVRLAGITQWLQVADRAAAENLPVVAHVGDMAQIHLHLSLAHPACSMLEYIPWMRDCFAEPAEVREGRFIPPCQPGAGTTLDPAALEKYNVKA